MTIAAGAFERHDPAGLARWGSSLGVVLALHTGLALFLIAHPILVEPPGSPPAAVMIDLAPLPAPPEPVPEPQPEPVQPSPPQLAEPEPPPPIAVPEIPPPPAEPPPKAVILPKPPPPPKPPATPRPIAERPPSPVPVPITAAPPAAIAPPATPMPSAAAITGARTNWQAQLLGFLSRNKRYPRPAQEQGQQGTASLRFAVDRQGRVLSFRLDRSSGFPLLDEEVLALIQRAQPLPPPPPEIPGDRIELVVPVEFSLRR